MRKLLLLALGLTALAACNKNLDVDGPIDASKNRLLSDKSWELKAYVVDSNALDSNFFYQDAYTNYPECQKDDYFTFDGMGGVTLNDHYRKCDVNTPDEQAYFYQLTDNENYLTIYGNPDDLDHSVLLAGKMTYKSLDTFLIQYQSTFIKGHDTLTLDNIRTYVKGIPD